MEKIKTGYQKYFAFIQPVVNDPLTRVYFSLALSLFLIAFLVFFALSPTVNTVLGLRKKIADQERIVAALDAKIMALVTAGENYNQLTPQLVLLDLALPENPHPQGLIDNVLRAATASAVTISSLQFKPVNLSGEGTNLEVGFSFSAKGEKTRLHDFLIKLENLLRYIRLEKLIVIFNNPPSGEASSSVDGQAVGYFINK